jgi:hypothetical protein
VGEGAASITVKQAFHIWRRRFEGVSRRGRDLYGAEAFLAKLRSLPQNKKLEQYSFENPIFVGSVFFEQTGGQYVGFVMADRRTKHRSEGVQETSKHLAAAGL